MTGRIETLGTEDTPGSIRIEGGVCALFDASEHLTHSASGLAVGQLVTFDLQKGSPPRARNISIEKAHYNSRGAEKRPQDVRYAGFQQKGNVRAYLFESVKADGETQTATVAVDLALFAKHHVGIQEGPALCLGLVMAKMHGSETESDLPPEQSLGDTDMLTYLARRAASSKASSSRKAKRPRAAGSAAASGSSRAHWPWPNS